MIAKIVGIIIIVLVFYFLVKTSQIVPFTKIVHIVHFKDGKEATIDAQSVTDYDNGRTSDTFTFWKDHNEEVAHIPKASVLWVESREIENK